MNDACVCGETEGVRPYAGGPACPAHTPAARAGNPEPDSQRYCAPLRCYCGQCASWVPDTTYQVGETVVDLRVKASGKRRSRSLTEYRDAQANTAGGAA